jgi:hypothetical protein
VADAFYRKRIYNTMERKATAAGQKRILYFGRQIPSLEKLTNSIQAQLCNYADYCSALQQMIGGSSNCSSKADDRVLTYSPW